MVTDREFEYGHMGDICDPVVEDDMLNKIGVVGGYQGLGYTVKVPKGDTYVYGVLGICILGGRSGEG